MNGKHGSILVVLAVAGLMAAGCAKPPAAATKTASAVSVEEIDGTELKRLTLVEKSAQRLGIQTAPVLEQGGMAVVPYAAVLYDQHGLTWVYTNPEPLVFLRAQITVDDIDGDMALLSAGPVSGTLVVTVGASELFGVESGVGGGH